MIKILPFAVILMIVLSSCGKMKPQAEVDDQTIQDYLAAHKLMAVKDPSGLYYIMNVTGTGTAPTVSSTIEVKYIGSLVNGSVFDQTAADKTFTYALSGLIKGWQIGIPLMKKGGKATFFIPSDLGYGSVNAGPIPANSVIIFEIELIDVK